MRQCVIIANSGAGSFSQGRFDRICARMAAGGLAVERRFCSDFAEMTATAEVASALPGSPLVVAAGGDGTINAIFNGLAGNNASCAILPMGTANVLAIELGIRSVEQAVSRIISGKSRPFTAGLIRNRGKCSRFFLMAGIGFDGAVVRGVTAGLKKSFGKTAYLISALGRLSGWERGELLITADNRQFGCHSLIVCNAANYGGRFRLAPTASIFSPALELIAVTDSTRRGIALLASEILSGRRSKSIVRLPVQNLTITGIKPVQADGDYWGDTPVEICSESSYAEIIV